ncbi:MAG: DUF1203 domain-containing protein [Gemmatimonadaceae bacterium]
MNFQVIALPSSEFEALYGVSDEELLRRGIRTSIATARPGFPCRVSLQDAEPGTRMFLMHYEHQSVNSPYRSSHAIYVQDGAATASVPVNHVPAVLRVRLLSVRAFDRLGMMIDADVIDGADAAPTFERLLGNDKTAYLHVHNAKRGCYAARVDRVSETQQS